MRLLEDDEAYLKEKGFSYDLAADGQAACLIIKDFPLAQGKFSRDSVDFMVCIPTGYNDAKLDNFYVDPELRLKSTGQYPQAADVFEQHANRRWQRFSRHLQIWRPGIDTLKSFLPCAYRELQEKC
jgi:E2/UBC family protein E